MPIKVKPKAQITVTLSLQINEVRLLHSHPLDIDVIADLRELESHGFRVFFHGENHCIIRIPRSYDGAESAEAIAQSLETDHGLSVLRLARDHSDIDRSPKKPVKSFC